MKCALLPSLSVAIGLYTWMAPQPPVRAQAGGPALPSLQIDAQPGRATPAPPQAIPFPESAAPSAPPQSIPSPDATTGKNRFVDLNTYGDRRDLPPLLPPAIELTERSTGCRTVLVDGKLVSATCTAPTGDALPVPSTLTTLPTPTANGDLPTISILGRYPNAAQTPNAVALAPLPGLPSDLAPPAPPPRLNPSNYVTSAIDSTLSAVARRRPRLKLPGNGDRAILNPLALPGRISSLFGWRTHPIFGDRRFHAGTDIAAPQGTPVLAAYSGRVATAGNLKGYGLTVILRHADDTQESRYAHLSEIAVRPGEWVAQGVEIGRVGNTGNSTGPHLHFEWRLRQGSEWVAVDTSEYLLARGPISLQPFRHDAGELTDDAELEPGARASWYVLPLTPTGQAQSPSWVRLALKAAPQTSNVIAFRWTQPLLPQTLATLLRWQPLQLSERTPVQFLAGEDWQE